MDNPSDRRRLEPLLTALESAGIQVNSIGEAGVQPADIVLVRGRPTASEIDDIVSHKFGNVIVFDDTNDLPTAIEPPVWREMGWRFAQIWRGETHPSLALRRLIANSDLVVQGSKCQASRIEHRTDSVWHIPDHVDRREYGRVRKRTGHSAGECVIAWEGTARSLPQLRYLTTVLRELAAECAIRLLVITDPLMPRRYLAPRSVRRWLEGFEVPVEFVPWSIDAFRENLLRADIAVAPIDVSDPFSRSKPCNKIISYWAFGLPVVCSRIPSYVALIRDGHDGFLAETEEEWKRHLRKLVMDPVLRRKIGRRGFRRAWTEWDVEMFTDRYIARLNRLMREVRGR